VRAVAVHAALVDVADEEVGAALVAAVADLPQQLLDRDAGLFCPALAEVVAVGADESRAVLRDALQPLWFAGTVVALDGVEREVQAAGALEQAHVPGTQLVDLLPAVQGGLGPLAGLERAGLRPAGGVRGDFLPHGLAEAVPQVPAVAGLDRAGQYPADRLAVGAGPVTAHDLNSRVAPQPLLRDISGAAGDDAARRPVWALMRTVAQTLPRRNAKSPVPSTRGTASAGSRTLSRTRNTVWRKAQMPSAGSRRAEARPANSRAIALTRAVSRVVRRW
jgi:hypothetical protein